MKIYHLLITETIKKHNYCAAVKYSLTDRYVTLI